jgi:hypothetical protein
MIGGHKMASDNPSGDAPSADNLAELRANIRDTAKWMGLAYAAVAAIFIASSPFSDIGSLELWRLALTVVAGFVTLFAFLFALNEILKFLIEDYCFASELSDETKKYIDDHADDILPARFQNYEAFFSERGDARKEVRENAAQLKLSDTEQSSENPVQVEVLQKNFDDALAGSEEFESTLATILGFAHCHELQQQLNMMRYRLAWMTVVAAAAMFVCVWAAKPPRSAASTASCDFAAELSYLTSCGQNGAALG